jgi:hypothetical protein
MKAAETGTADPHRHAIAKLTTSAQAAETLSVRERVLVFCIASDTDWTKVGMPVAPSSRAWRVRA